jgi:crotonobetainyl-CoA:carnitine CoA-transferase CaiB-like acyl-CoA transferase
MLLADFGARVIKVESPSGDTARWLDAPVFNYASRGKESIVLNLKAEEDRAVALEIARTAQVLVEGFRPGVAARLGMGYDAIRELNPGIVYCSISGYGATGPYASLPGHDLNYQAVAGWLAVAEGHAEGRLAERIPVGDLSAGALAAVGILAMLQSGRGGYLDMSITDCLLSWRAIRANPPLLSQASDGVDPTYGVFVAADGRYIALGVLEDHFWVSLCSALSLDDLASDPDLATLEGRRRNGARVQKRVADSIAARPSAEVFDALSRAGTPASIMNRGGDLSRDAQLQTRSVLSTSDPDRPGSVFGTIPTSKVPDLDEHRDRIRAEFTPSPDKIVRE